MSSNGKFRPSDLYENFLARDLTFIAGGGLFLTSLAYLLNPDIMSLVDYFTNNVIAFIVFCIISYFAGIILQESGALIHLVKLRIEGSYEYINAIARINYRLGHESLKRLERTIFIKQVFATFSTSSLLSAIFILVTILQQRELTNATINEIYEYYYVHLIIIYVLYIVSVACQKANHIKWNEENTIIRESLRRLSPPATETQDGQ